VILPDGGLERSQQVFSDLNRTVLKTSKSLDILYDHRSPLNRITNACVEQVKLFKGRIDKERVSLSIRAADFATLSGVQRANEQLLGELHEGISDADYKNSEALAIEFWESVTTLVDPWDGISTGIVRPADARVDYLSSYALAMWAIGAVGQTVMAEADARGTKWTPLLADLKSVDWRKVNPEWQGICMQGTDVITRVTTRRAMADMLRWKVGLGDRPAAVV
jgi:DNA sulfur modification protein DndB